MNGQRMDVNLVLSPLQTEEKDRDREEKEQIRQNILKQLRRGTPKELTT